MCIRDRFGHTTEDSDYTSAFNILDDAIKELSPGNQRRNSLYNKTDRELNATNNLVFEAENAVNLISENSDELVALKRQKAENDKLKTKLENDLKLVASKKILEKDLKDYNALNDEINNLNLQIEENKKLFAGNKVEDTNLVYLEELSTDLSAKESEFNRCV